LRDLAYIYCSVGEFEKSVDCFLAIYENGGVFTVVDALTLSHLNECNNISFDDLDISAINKSCDYFKCDFVVNGSHHLFITLSPNDKYVLRGYSVEADRLSLVDMTASYFVLAKERIVELVDKLVVDYDYKKISIVGSSKGGTGALMLYEELAKKLDLPISCVAFSPQMKLFPFNDNLAIPSYRRFANVFMCNKLISSVLENMRQPFEISKLRGQDKVTIVYGIGFSMDRSEVSLLDASSDIDILELEFSGHTSSIPLTIPEGKTVEELRDKYKSLTMDEDFKALGGEGLVDIVDQIYNIYSNPDMRLHKLL